MATSTHHGEVTLGLSLGLFSTLFDSDLGKKVVAAIVVTIVTVTVTRIYNGFLDSINKGKK